MTFNASGRPVKSVGTQERGNDKVGYQAITTNT